MSAYMLISQNLTSNSNVTYDLPVVNNFYVYSDNMHIEQDEQILPEDYVINTQANIQDIFDYDNSSLLINEINDILFTENTIKNIDAQRNVSRNIALDELCRLNQIMGEY